MRDKHEERALSVREWRGQEVIEKIWEILSSLTPDKTVRSRAAFEMIFYDSQINGRVKAAGGFGQNFAFL